MPNKPKISQYGSVDPAPPLKSGKISQWESTLTNPVVPMFQRMRNVFSLRNDGSDAACIALCSGFNSTAHYYVMKWHMYWGRCRMKSQFLH